MISFKDLALDFNKKTHIMGILNVTPDSFSDGGMYLDKENAIKQVFKLIEDGADIIDIGGESTRPGAKSVSTEEELSRVLPVIKSISSKINIPISIDTYKSQVAKETLKAGASIVNDISGLTYDPDMARIISRYKAAVVIMHIKGKPEDMQINPIYEALIPEIMDYLRKSISIATKAGISEDKIIIDPGIGFGKTFEHNLEILNNLNHFKCLAKPIMVGVSKKTFIGKILGDVPPSERLEGTMSAVAISIFNGANIVRVHDVKEISKIRKVADAIKFCRLPVI